MTDWAIPQQAKLKYTQLFNLHDRSRSGFLSGLQCRDILLQSGLPRNTLAEIWNLSDIDGDGQLTREEFILAMHLTNHVRSGQNLPTELPSDLVPPSYRRTRSSSATSVHSVASAGSSISGNNDDQTSQKSSDNVASAFASSSVLNSNSFEDKRRENFEKGRAELERRRLNIIEQQSAILKEQLSAGKKQVTEAKAKIDAMRTERDSKMGMITSLEAQLQSLRDKKTYLDHEELSLIAIAKDLNLVDEAQAELDQLATQAKQQSINQMKEKLVEFSKQNEEKSKELVEATNCLEESKKQLRSLSDTISKTYEIYKEKVANAKVMREQFINENKSKTPDLDSVWDTAPSFSSQSDTNMTASEDPWAPKVPGGKPNAFTGISTNSDFLTSTDLSLKLSEPDENNGFEPKIPEPMPQGKKYHALYAFEARNPDELTINPGDIIIGSDEVCEPGWISGNLNGRVGLFPEAYVEALAIEQPGEPIKNNVPIGQAHISPSTNPNESSQSINASTELPVKYKVVYAFDARNPDELTINPGDIITGFEGIHEPGWLCGELNGHRGLFPEAYVERITDIVQDPPEAGKSRSKRAEVATVIANYRALGQEQLSLEKGQLVLIRRKMDSGWWEGEIQVKESDEFELDKAKNELDNLINELIRSEIDYIDDLLVCKEAYILPLSESFDISHIFVKWDELIQIHKLPLAKLTNSLAINIDHSLVLNTFKNLLSSLDDLYIEFCSQQNESTRMFESKLASDVRFKQLVKECQRNLSKLAEQQVPGKSDGRQMNSRSLGNSKLPLTSFILKPMQRITKYSLISERLVRIVKENGPQELIGLCESLRTLAQRLCSRVNEACRVKEEYEANKRKLRWAQAHIKQIANNLDGSKSPPGMPKITETISFSSNTDCMGDRKLIKSGCMVKRNSGKEIVVFLFNDMLLLTQIKGSTSLRVEDVFQSTKAQQSYYKLYRAPILLEDVVLRPDQTTDSQTLTTRCSWAEHQLLTLSFYDNSNGVVYSLMAMNVQEKCRWVREISEWSIQAREAKARYRSRMRISNLTE